MNEELTPEEKISVLERIVLSVFRGQEIRYKSLGRGFGGYITIVDVPKSPEATLAGYDGEGLSMNYDIEMYEDSWPAEIGMADGPVESPRLNLEIWWGTNLWDEIDRLKKEVEECKKPKRKKKKNSA